MRLPSVNRAGFSTIIAMLLTAFLIVLSAGILNLFLTENRINHFFFDGIATYMGAEWSLEYALLKWSNHREGFGDRIVADNRESQLLSSEKRRLRITYETRSFGRSYSGAITPGQFEIIPLFVDAGKPLSDDAKHPNAGTSDLKKTTGFILRTDGAIAWNIVANDANGTTFGLVGTWSARTSIGDDPSATVQSWFEKFLGTERLETRTRTIKEFLMGYENAYLVLYSTSDTPISYSLTSATDFAFPTRSIIASSSIGTSQQNIEFREDRSKLFDILKYSLFNQ